jgi:hypothetical protein
MLLDFYHNEQHKDKYLRNYGFKEYNQLPLQVVNLTQKIIDKISLVYKYAPDRYLAHKQGASDKDEYGEFISQNDSFNFVLKQAERYKNLLHNVLFRPMYYKDKWRFWVETDWIPYFDEGDPLEPIAYSIPVKRDVYNAHTEKVEDRQWYMFWSNEYYFWHDEFGEIKADPLYPDRINPFGIIPFVEMRKHPPIDEYWQQGTYDLVLCNQAINILLNNLNYSIHFQSFDQPYIKGADKQQAENIKVGHQKIIGLSDPTMDIGLLQYNPKIVETYEAIKFHVELISRRYNINVDWAMSGDPSSGFALLVKNIDLMEAREDDVEIAVMNEKRIYDVIQRQTEVLNTGYNLPRRDNNIKLVVDFQDIQFPLNQAEDIERWNWEIANNIATPVDYIQSKNPDLSEEEALEKWTMNKALNKKLSQRQETLQNAVAEANNQPQK